MFIDKINNTSFKGYQHFIDSTGAHAYKHYRIHDNASQSVKIEFSRKNDNGEYEVFKTIDLDKENITKFDSMRELKSDEPVFYKLFINGKHVPDTGLLVDGYNIINRVGTYPLNQGAAILTMPDTHMPGAQYEGFNSERTGDIVYHPDVQKASEKVIRTFSNAGGGTLAGLEYDIDNLKNTVLFTTPIWGGDDKSSHHYWNKNDMWIAPTLGNIDNYETFARKCFMNGVQLVDDFAVTSYGIESLPMLYTNRFAIENPQTMRWMHMDGLQNGPIELGVVPKNKPENMRYRAVNPNVIYNSETGKVEANPTYDSKIKKIKVQLYDMTQVTKEQLENKDKLISSYQNTYSDNKLAINNYADTLIPYVLEFTPQEYKSRLEEYVKMKKKANETVNLDSAEAALFIAQSTNFKIGKDGSGIVCWDANHDINKRNYYISGYNEKRLNSIPDLSKRDSERELLKRANYECQDNTIQAAIYRTQFIKDAQILCAAQKLGNTTDLQEINNIFENVLKGHKKLDSKTVANIIDDWYQRENKCIEEKDDITLKALMKMPLSALDLDELTTAVLSTSFFTNIASSEENIGLSRYEFYKQGAGVYAPYYKTYHSMDNLFETKIKDFANEVIAEVNKNSSEKLLNQDGSYTEYGEYVIGLVGKDITKYAILKALLGRNLKTKVMPDDVLKGKVTYDNDLHKELTSLEKLGINVTGQENTAVQLLNKLSDGLNGLEQEDIKYLAGAISKRIEGTTTIGFRLAEAIVNRAGLGLSFRLDACKDIVDMDAVRNGDMTFDDAWDQVIDFWKKFVKTIKKINPNAYIVAEITDMEALMRAQYGENANVWSGDLSVIGGKYKNVPDALQRFYAETGITSEASYSYTFTDGLRVFSADAEHGIRYGNGLYGLKDRIRALLDSNNLDYIKNVWTFADNHDKPSVLHAMALDMELFHTANLTPIFENFTDNAYCNDGTELRKRNARIAIMQELTNSDNFEDMPLEAMMNIDNINYFNTVSPRAAAMSQLLRSAINDRLPDSFDKKQLLKKALVDLTNGNYYTNNANFDVQTINIPELKTLEGALNEILNSAEMNLDEGTKQEIIRRAKTRGRIERFAIRDDFNTLNQNNTPTQAAIELQNRAKSVLANEEWDFMKYSPYTVSVAALLLDSYKEVVNGYNVEKFINGTRNFVHKFDRATVQKNTASLPYTEDNEIAIKKKTYAAREIDTAIEMMIQQAELKSGIKFSQEDKDYILKEVFESAVEPAAEKALMYAAFLNALPGIPSIYYRDMFGATGYDEKAKNQYLQNRNTPKWSEIKEDGPLKEIKTKIYRTFQEIMQVRKRDDMEALRSGTPHYLETNHPNAMAMLYENENNDAVITILNNFGVDTRSRKVYDLGVVNDSQNAVNTINNNNKYVPVRARLELNEILLPESLSIPVGTIFTNIASNDKAEYIINKLENGLYRLIRKDGGNIVLNGETANHGAMFLKKAGQVVFRGNNINQQYRIITNPYKKAKTQLVGENLSIISK